MEKVDRLRSQVLQSVSDIKERPQSSAKWSNFQPVTISACKYIIEHLRPTVCPYDVMQARFLKQVVHIVGSDVSNLVNLSLSTGIVPDSLKYALITAILKKPNSDTLIFSNFRPVSNLSFMSKILEKVVLVQLQVFLRSNQIYEMFQSGFRKLHSTETALL